MMERVMMAALVTIAIGAHATSSSPPSPMASTLQAHSKTRASHHAGCAWAVVPLMRLPLKESGMRISKPEGTSPRNRRRPCIISMPAMAAVAAGDDDSGSGNVPSVKTRVQLRAPLMNRAQLERYVRTDRNIRTLRADLPRLLERSMTADVFANNITMDGDILGGTVVRGRADFFSFFDNVRRLQSLSQQGLVLRVTSVHSNVTAVDSGEAEGDQSAAATPSELIAAVRVELEWVSASQLSQLSQFPGGELIVRQLQPILRSARSLELSVRARLRVDAHGYVDMLTVQQVLLNDDTALLPAFVRWARALVSSDLVRAASASIELARAAAASLPGVSLPQRPPTVAPPSQEITPAFASNKTRDPSESPTQGWGGVGGGGRGAGARVPLAGSAESRWFVQVSVLALDVAEDMPMLMERGKP
jgi:hypothetical protein